MLKLGDKTIYKMMLGDKFIKRAYLGEKLAFKGEPLFLDYIETDGDSYIDTGYYPSENTVIEYTYEITGKISEWSGLFGSRQSADAYSYNIFVHVGNYLRVDYGSYSDSNIVYYNFNTKYTLKAGTNEVYINDELVKSYEPLQLGISPYSIYLGNFNNAGTPYTKGAIQKIYGCKIYENEVLLHEFRPCIHQNGTVCFFDMVSKKYFYNQGTGTLDYKEEE